VNQPRSHRRTQLELFPRPLETERPPIDLSPEVRSELIAALADLLLTLAASDASIRKEENDELSNHA
jgi:hypothetical protein